MMYKSIFSLVVGVVFFANISNSFGYAIVHGRESDLPEVDMYVFDNQQLYEQYLKEIKVPTQFIAYMLKITELGKTLGEKANGYTDGMSGPAMSLVDQITRLYYGLYETFKVDIDRFFIGYQRLAAFHKRVGKGNQGRHAEWNWKSIAQQRHLPQGASMYLLITEPGTMTPLYAGALATDGLFGFVVRKDPVSGLYYGVASYGAMAEYTPSR